MLKEIAVSAFSRAKEIYDTIDIIVDYRVGIFPLIINAMLLTHCSPHGAVEVSFNLCNPLNERSAEHDIILESYAKINSRLEMRPQTS